MRRRLALALALALLLLGCGTAPTTTTKEVTVRTDVSRRVAATGNSPDPFERALAGQVYLDALTRAAAAARAWLAALPPPPPPVIVAYHTSTPEVVPVAAPVTTPPATGGVWACIANAETGGVPAPGPTYWTVFGMVTGIITEYGSPAQQAAVFNGTASFATQLDIATRFANDHGFGGWGWLTRQKCGL